MSMASPPCRIATAFFETAPRLGQDYPPVSGGADRAPWGEGAAHRSHFLRPGQVAISLREIRLMATHPMTRVPARSKK